MLLDMMEVEHRAAAMAAEYFMTLYLGSTGNARLIRHGRMVSRCKNPR